jgi:hypothetical protein
MAVGVAVMRMSILLWLMMKRCEGYMVFLLDGKERP